MGIRLWVEKRRAKDFVGWEVSQFCQPQYTSGTDVADLKRVNAKVDQMDLNLKYKEIQEILIKRLSGMLTIVQSLLSYMFI